MELHRCGWSMRSAEIARGGLQWGVVWFVVRRRDVRDLLLVLVVLADRIRPARPQVTDRSSTCDAPSFLRACCARKSAFRDR
jgi:hypothetical protein